VVHFVVTGSGDNFGYFNSSFFFGSWFATTRRNTRIAAWKELFGR
jgi:hypothetical protein